MADIKRVSPEEAEQLLARGYTFIDVRSESEYEAGHVPAARNVPIQHVTAAGMTPNADFLSVMQRCFGTDSKLLVGCRSGGRSMKAASVLAGAGFTDVVDLRTGWEGCRGTFGQLEPGWGKKGLPVETGQPEGCCYADLKKT